MESSSRNPRVWLGPGGTLFERIDLDSARELLWADCDKQTVAIAFERPRPQCAFPFTAPLSLAELPTVSCTSIICTEDQLINPEWSGGLLAALAPTSSSFLA